MKSGCDFPQREHAVASKPYRGRRAFLASAVTPVVASCSASDIANLIAPRSGYAVQAGIPYGRERRQKLDLYLPEGMPQSASLLVFFYGGNWENGDRGTYRFVASTLARQGYAVAVPDYRLYPDVRYPEFLRDCAVATAFLQRQTGALGLPTGPLILMGHSAGAYNAIELVMDPRWLREAGAVTVDAAIGLAGPYDFLPLRSEMLRDLFNADRDPAGLPETQPIRHARAAAPPLLLLHGLADTTVSPRNSERLDAAQKQLGASSTLVEYPDIGHIGLIAALARPVRLYSAPVLRDITRFIGNLT